MVDHSKVLSLHDVARSLFVFLWKTDIKMVLQLPHQVQHTTSEVVMTQIVCLTRRIAATTSGRTP